jgi:hypothetical protein
MEAATTADNDDNSKYEDDGEEGDNDKDSNE